MATFILVHGSFHGGWCWEAVVQRLEADGHRAIAPDLPGMGEDGIAPEDVSLQLTGGFIADLARAQEEKVILVGHSFGGATISTAAELAPEAVLGLIYVTAVILPNGSRAIDLVMRTGSLPKGVTESRNGALHTMDPEHGRERYYRGCDAALATAAASRMRPQPTRPMHDIMIATPERWGRLPRAFVECLQDNAVPTAFQRSMHEAAECHPVFSMDTGHSPFVEDPDTLVAHLVAAADDFAKRQDNRQ